jgi:hypothetical protein
MTGLDAIEAVTGFSRALSAQTWSWLMRRWPSPAQQQPSPQAEEQLPHARCGQEFDRASSSSSAAGVGRIHLAEQGHYPLGQAGVPDGLGQQAAEPLWAAGPVWPWSAESNVPGLALPTRFPTMLTGVHPSPGPSVNSAHAYGPTAGERWRTGVNETKTEPRTACAARRASRSPGGGRQSRWSKNLRPRRGCTFTRFRGLCANIRR